MNGFSDLMSLPFYGKYFGAMIKKAAGAAIGKPQRVNVGDGIITNIVNTAGESAAAFGRAANKAGGGVSFLPALTSAAEGTTEVVLQFNGVPYYGPKDIVKSLKAWFGSDAGGAVTVEF